MKKILRYIVFLLCLPTVLLGQDLEKEDEVRYPKWEFGIGANINTVGALPGGINARYARHLFDKHYATIQLDIFNVRHPKEAYYLGDSTNWLWIPFKTNYLYSVRPMVGWEFLFFRKERDEGLQLRWVIALGPSLGFIKPNMVLIGRSRVQNYSIPFEDYYNQFMLTGRRQPVYGDRPFDGFDRMKVMVGFNFKTSIMLEFGTSSRSMTGIEAGFQFETFGNQVPLMVQAQNSSTFTSAFLTLFFGARKY